MTLDTSPEKCSCNHDRTRERPHGGFARTLAETDIDGSSSESLGLQQSKRQRRLYGDSNDPFPGFQMVEFSYRVAARPGPCSYLAISIHGIQRNFN